MKGPLSIPPESNSSQAGTSLAEDFSSAPMATKHAGPPVLFPIFIEILPTSRHACLTTLLCLASARNGLLCAAPASLWSEATCFSDSSRVPATLRLMPFCVGDQFSLRRLDQDDPWVLPRVLPTNHRRLIGVSLTGHTTGLPVLPDS